jgi:hypothetical protein
MDNASAATLEPRLCPFLRAVNDGQLADPIRWPDQANACTALGDAAPQSLRQQEYACLASAHVNCPRFVRGVHLMVETAPNPADSGLRLTPAILGALLVLAASFALSVGFVVANGGMDLPAASASPQAGIESAAPSPAISTAPVASEPPAESAAPSVEPSAQASVEAATATPTTPAARHRQDGDTRPSSIDTPCSSPADEPDCWIYTVRQATTWSALRGTSACARGRHRAQSVDRDHRARGGPGTPAASADPLTVAKRRRGSSGLTGPRLLEALERTFGVGIIVTAIDDGLPVTIEALLMFGGQREQVRGAGQTERDAWKSLGSAIATWRAANDKHIAMWGGGF